jgi:hypothetical protein
MTMWSHSQHAQAEAIYRPGLYLLGRLKLAEAPARERFQILRALAAPNGMYDDVIARLRDEGDWAPSIKPLAQPTSTVVRFYGAKLLGGPPLEIEADNEAIIEPLEQFHRWSNLDAMRPMLGRQIAMLGDAFYKVVRKLGPDGRTAKSVYLEVLDPATVRDFDVDERGYVVWIRIEVQRVRRKEDGTLEDYTYIEVWDKALSLFRSWEWNRRQGGLTSVASDDLSRLGTPKEEIPLAQMGIDFVPVVHVPFERQDDDRWGKAAVWDQIEKLVELDLLVTELHRKMFGYGVPDLLLHSPGLDPNGNPRIPPDLQEIQDLNGTNTLVIGREKVYSLPGGWDLKYLIADLDWANARRLVLDHYQRLERERPELLYGRVAELEGGLSGRAIRYMMLPAIDLVQEVYGNLSRGLAQAGMMALTIGQFAGLFGDLGGNFDSGAFEHTFKDRDPFPLSDEEEAAADLQRAQGAKVWVEVGLPMGEVLQRAGYTEDQAEELVSQKAAEIEPVEAEDEMVGVQ